MVRVQSLGRSRAIAVQTLTLLALLSSLAPLVRAQVSFQKPDFSTGKGPASISAADLNRDGLPDVVTANSTANSVSVLLNNGNGTFSPHTDYPAGKNPVALITGDFNHDGVPDVAVVNHDDNTVSIFLGNGNGTLKAFTTISVGAKPDALVAADFNRDGKLDLAVLNQGSNSVSIYLGNGDGSFSHKADYVAGPNPASSVFLNSLAAADFNGDSVPDLAVTNGSNTVNILLGNGDGSFHPGVAFDALNGSSGVVGSVVAADFNQDGKIDLAVQVLVSCRDCGPIFSIYGGRGDGAFDQGHGPNVATDGASNLLAVDLNGDHVPDVVAAPAVVLVNPATVLTNASQFVKFMPSTGLGVQAVAAGDFNGDGKTDLVTANFSDDTVSPVLGNNDGTFHQPLRFPFPAAGTPDAIASADFNHDGVSDLVVKNTSSPGFWLYLGNRDGTFRAPVQMSTDLRVYLIAAADFNHDGIPDVVANGLLNSNSQGTIRVFLGNGDGTFRAPIDSSAQVGGLDGMRFADFNGDGIPDVVLRASGSTPGVLNDVIAIYFGNGDGTFRAGPKTTIPFASAGVAVGDFNRDGFMDVVVGFSNIAVNGNSFTIYLGNNDGTFRTGQSYPVPGDVSSIASADLNRDGVPDLAVGNDHSLTTFLGNGDGTFKQTANTSLYQGPTQVQIADINGDGMPDVIIADTRLSILLGNGNGTFQPAQDFGIGGADDFAIADFNSDGHPDIAVSNGFTNASFSLMLSGSGPAAARDFRLSLSATSATVKAGQSANLTAFVAAIGSFKDSVTFSCAGLPAGATCRFTPATVTPGANGPASSTLTIATTARTSAAVVPASNSGLIFALALPMFGIALGRVRAPGKCKLALLLVLLAAALFMFQGCAGGSGSSSGSNPGGSNPGGGTPGGSGTPAGTYAVTVVATSGGSPVITHSQAVTLTVQ